MEELRSTEILEKEIQSDARRKVEKILKNADADCEKILASVKTRFEKTQTEKKAANQKKIDDYIKNADTAIPLEKGRKTVSFIDSKVHLSVDNYFNNLSQEKKIKLISSLVSRFKNILKNSPLEISYNGFSRAEVDSILKTTLGVSVRFDATEVSLKNADIGLLIMTKDESVLCRATLSEIKYELFEKYRFELQNTLFGGRFKE